MTVRRRVFARGKLARVKALTSVEVQNAVAAVRPEWLRIPDATRMSGIGRSSLYELIREGKIKSVCLRKRNGIRGIRLISADSLCSLIESALSSRGES